jgi:hypothetical protein
VFPSKLALMQDKSIAERDSNPSFERMQKIKDKRVLENSI